MIPEAPTARTGEAIAADVETAFRTYTVQSTQHAYAALTLYVFYTHVSEHFDYAPRLVLTSAEKRSGKTRTLDVLEVLVRNSVPTVNASTAALFRIIGGNIPPVIILDEADTIFGTKIKAEQNEDLRGLLNSGAERGRPFIRCVGPNQEPAEFTVFAPAVLGGIGTLPDTITDRAVNLRLRRRKPSEKVSPYRRSVDGPKLVSLSEEVAQWAQSLDVTTLHGIPDSPLTDRPADVWSPLLTVADALGGQWPERARAAAVAITNEAAENDNEGSAGLELLRDIQTLLEVHPVSFIPTADLLQRLRNLEESVWAERDLTPRALSQLLKPYGVHARRDTQGRKRGYRAGDLRDVIDRYIHPHTPAEIPEDPAVNTPAPEAGPVPEKPQSDTYIRQTKNKRQNVSAGQTPYLTHLTGLTRTYGGTSEEPTDDELTQKFNKAVSNT